MRYAIVSDIHANLTAWKTVLNDIADMRADQIICLGDVLGYGPHPVEVLESVYQTVHVTLLGNHDAAICGKLDTDLFSKQAQEAVHLHREQISDAGIRWLRELPLVLSTPEFRCTHGDFSSPADFYYISEPEDALPSWQATDESLLFVGHSHTPGVHVLGSSGTPHLLDACDFELEPGKRYIVNPGSVGYPRAGHFRSTYCLFDDVAQTLVFRELPFDGESYRAALHAAGLEDAPWLKQQALCRYRPDVRSRRSFANPQHVQSRGSRWTHRKPLLFWSIGVLALIILSGALTFYAGKTIASSPLSTLMPPYPLSMIAAYPLLANNQNLLPVLPETFTQDNRLKGWRYAFDDRTRQAFSIGLRDSNITLCIHNQEHGRVMLESPLIDLSGTGLKALRLKGRIRKHDSFAGHVTYQVLTYTQTTSNTLTHTRTFHYDMRSSRQRLTPLAADRNVKIPISAHVTHVQFRVEAAFIGQLEIEQPILTEEPTRRTS